MELELRSDYEVGPNRLVLTVHPNDYNRVAEMLKAGLLVIARPQTVDGEVIEDGPPRLIAHPAPAP